MQITVTIPDELAAEIQSRGMTPQSYLESLIAKQLCTQQSSSLPAILAELYFLSMATKLAAN